MKQGTKPPEQREGFRDEFDNGPIELTAHMNEFRTDITWYGRARPGVVGYALYAWTLTPEGNVPIKLNKEMLPLSGTLFDPNPDAKWPEDDPLEEFLKEEPAESSETVSIEYIKTWVDFLKTGRNPLLKPCRCEESDKPLVEPGKYFLVDLYNGNRQGGTTVMANRNWTDEDKNKRDKKIKDALDEIRKKGLTDGIPGGLSFDDLMGHIPKGVKGDKGKQKPDGRTFPGPPDPVTKKNTSEVILNGDKVLDKSLKEVIALILHELVHVGQNLNHNPPKDLKDIVIDRIIREIEAYVYEWGKLDAIGLNPGSCGVLAADAVAAMIRYYDDFSEELKKVESEPTKKQRDAIKAMKLGMRKLFLLYQAFFKQKAAKPLIDLLGKSNLVKGKVLDIKEVIDHYLTNVFPG